MNLKEMIFGGNVRPGGDSGAYRDSIQAWIPIKNIMGGVVITKDDRFVKILEVLPVNIYLKSPNDRQNIISSFAAYLKIAPNDLQMVVRDIACRYAGVCGADAALCGTGGQCSLP